jgi:uncharacterized damage-inducible protein DinB
MLQKVEEFVSYFDAIRKRTLQYAKVIPASMMDWGPVEGKFTTGEILRHLGSAEVMFVHVLQHGEWTYSGHEKTKGATLEEALHYMDKCHARLKEGILTVGDELLVKKVPTLHGHEVSGWKIAMAMAEHEMHHRGQLSTYLQLKGVEPPQIFGLKIEDVHRSD